MGKVTYHLITLIPVRYVPAISTYTEQSDYDFSAN